METAYDCLNEGTAFAKLIASTEPTSVFLTISAI